jgi:GMP synthase (glutamine-hydrolysing)
MEFAVIDNNVHPMKPDSGRGLGFIRALSEWEAGKQYEFVRYEEIARRFDVLLNCRGLILTGSAFDLALDNGELNRELYERMAPQIKLMRDTRRPVLGICYGHQLMALGDEFQSGRTGFGQVLIGNMANPQNKYLVTKVCMTGPLRFLEQRELWVQFNHKQEVVRNAGLLNYYDVLAGSDRCPVQIIQHKSRDWFGVQFHPEVGKPTEAGEIAQEDAAIRDGQALLQAFVHYCLH